MIVLEATAGDVRRGPVLALFLALLCTFLLTRFITRRIHSGGKTLKNWQIGGVHVHHQVFGIIAVLVAGSLEFAYRPAQPWVSLLAALFGAGTSLTLDEFALWLYLDDVYWSPEGRKSIDAVFVAIAITALMVLGIAPFDLRSVQHDILAVVALILFVNLAFAVLTMLKGKPVVGILSLFLPSLAIIGSIRLAKPSSPWARRRYPEGSPKLARSQSRFGPEYQERWNRVRDLIGGSPSLHP
jgi:hypothetical protein